MCGGYSVPQPYYRTQCVTCWISLCMRTHQVKSGIKNTLNQKLLFVNHDSMMCRVPIVKMWCSLVNWNSIKSSKISTAFLLLYYSVCISKHWPNSRAFFSKLWNVFYSRSLCDAHNWITFPFTPSAVISPCEAQRCGTKPRWNYHFLLCASYYFTCRAIACLYTV